MFAENRLQNGHTDAYRPQIFNSQYISPSNLIPTHLYIECDNMKCSFAERNHITNTPITSFCSENSRNKKCLEDFYRDMLHKEKRKRGAQKMFISKCGDTTQNVLHWSFRTSQIKH